MKSLISKRKIFEKCRIFKKKKKKAKTCILLYVRQILKKRLKWKVSLKASRRYESINFGFNSMAENS